MSLSDNQEEAENEEVVELFAAGSFMCDEVPPEEWESLLMQGYDETTKRYLYSEGLYDPGSGEICTKYIPLSDSAVFNHPLYKYNAILDPGITTALLDPPEKPKYPDDGQEKYLATCSEMSVRPIDRFYQGLLLTEIDLSYYNLRSSWVRAMAIALKFNKHVKVLNLMDNFLNNDACHHLGDMLVTNRTLTELNMSGCRIGDNGLRNILVGIEWNHILKVLNLDKNALTDEAGESLAESIVNGLNIVTISIRHNSISSDTLAALGNAFKENYKFKSVDFSWNALCNLPKKVNKFLIALSENTNLQEVNLSWTGLSGEAISEGLKSLVKAPQLIILNLSNNRLYDQDVSFVNILVRAKKLHTLDLSYNPLSPAIALKLIEKMLLCAKLEQLLLDNIDVPFTFKEILNKVLHKKPDALVTYGNIITDFIPKGPDLREMLLNRVEHVLKQSKKAVTVDIALVVLQLWKDGVKIIAVQEFMKYIKSHGGVLDEDLVEGLAEAFPGSYNIKLSLIGVKIFADYVRRKWPERQLPPTPPPEPEPPAPEVKKGKGKKGGKGKGGA